MTFERNVKGLLGTKLGMTQLWDENNKVVPVTVVAAATNVVTQVRTPEVDGYNAVQIGYGEIEGRKVTKPSAGHFAKAGTTPRRHVVEIRTASAGEYTVGQELAVDTFAAGEEIDVPDPCEDMDAIEEVEAMYEEHIPATNESLIRKLQQDAARLPLHEKEESEDDGERGPPIPAGPLAVAPRPPAPQPPPPAATQPPPPSPKTHTTPPRATVASTNAAPPDAPTKPPRTRRPGAQ